MGLHSEADDGKDSVRGTGITADVAAGCLSGCNRTIIEHQFHTDTVTDVEYIIENTGTNLDGVYNLQKYFLSYGIGVDIIFDPFQEVAEGEDMGEIDSIPTLEYAENFLSEENCQLSYVTKCDKDSTSWLAAYSKAANIFYNLFIKVKDETWEDKIDDTNPQVAFVGVPLKQGSDYYVSTYISNLFTEDS